MPTIEESDETAPPTNHDGPQLLESRAVLKGALEHTWPKDCVLNITNGQLNMALLIFQSGRYKYVPILNAQKKHSPEECVQDTMGHLGLTSLETVKSAEEHNQRCHLTAIEKCVMPVRTGQIKPCTERVTSEGTMELILQSSKEFLIYKVDVAQFVNHQHQMDDLINST